MSNVHFQAVGTSFLCLDNKGQKTTDNNPTITWQCNSADKAQIWTQYNDNTIRINSGKDCLDVNKNGKTDNTAVNIFHCVGGPNEKWILESNGKGGTQLRDSATPSGANAKCLDIKQALTNNGTPMEIFKCNGGANQAWHWVTGKVTPPKQTHNGILQSGIQSKDVPTKNLCLDDKGLGSADNNPVITFPCNTADVAQQWTSYNDGTIQIKGKCLDVNKSGTADRTPVNIFTCNGGNNQKWQFTTVSGHPVIKANNGSGNKCLDIKGSSKASGTQLEIFTCSGNANQQWTWH